VAIDLGASSGRVLFGGWDGARFGLDEVCRFANGPVAIMGHLHWDVLSIWAQIKSGLTQSVAGELVVLAHDRQYMSDPT
jgi:rhamnulokinase